MTFSMLCAPNSGTFSKGIDRSSRPPLRITIESSLRKAPSSTSRARLNGCRRDLSVPAIPHTSGSSRFRMALSAGPWFLKMRVLAL